MVTSEGTVIIQTITTISTPSSLSNQNRGLTKGAVAGLVVGILAAILAFIVGAILFRRHKRRMQSQEAVAAGGMGRRGSSAGIMSKAGTMSSSGFGMAMEEDGSYGSSGRRMSMKPIDPRLDPKVGLYRIASHDSLNTIRDDQDYSRRVQDAPRIMRVTNPDPDPAD
ncbi:Cell wall integrity and stress response component 4 [Cytospora paraplurivora]|uniref:Cell wall integrity and stress response component 4 n=1 Tax=Cytospora paraplurivora TaxID=2898453 RepID=A0AAN9YKW8_9PEZI